MEQIIGNVDEKDIDKLTKRTNMDKYQRMSKD